MISEATFGAGCFWHVEEIFFKTKGVVETEVGFMGGDEKRFPNPSYKDVCEENTGYAEVVHLKFDDKKISYPDLLKIFFTSHDPTQFHKQGPDIGSQYRGVIFYYNPEQKKIADKIKKDYQKKTREKIVTEIVRAGRFVRAEEEHQKYFKKHPVYCRIVNLFGGK